MKTILTILMATTLFASCRKETVWGSGTVSTELRNIPAFTNVQIEGSSSIEVIKGTQQRVEVSGYSNLVPNFQTTVSNGTLVMKFRSDFINVRNNNIKVKIELPVLSSVSLNGSGNIYVDHFNGTSLSAIINGSGEVNAGNCTYTSLYARVNGSGKLRTAQIIADDVDASISGSGNIEVTATQKIKARISGSGEIKFYGNPPATDVDVSGSGKVKRL